MLTNNSRRKWMIAFAVTAIGTPYTMGAQEAEAIEPVVIATLQDEAAEAEATEAAEAPAEQPAEDETEAALPAPIEMAAEPAPAPCNCCKPNCCCTKEKKEAATAAMKGAFKGLFYANNFGYLNDPCYDGPAFCGDNLKGLCCNRLDLGGEIRVRYHDEDNHRGLGLTGRDDNFWLTRYRAFADWRINDYFRFYGEYLYADSAGERFNNRPIEENRGEAQNLFLDAKLTSNLTLRVGRQELLYGAQRLISPLDWANTRRTFEGVRGLYQGDTWSIDGFFVHPVRRNASTESKIDDALESIDFFGVYASRGDLSIGNLDVYYLGLNNDQVTPNQLNNFDYHTIGSRVVGKTDGGTLYEFEGGYQFGSNQPGFGDHNAGFVTGGIGRKFSICTRCGEWNPIIWLWYDWASGGDDVPANRGDNGFDHLFPLAHKYNGFMDLFGRRNLNDVNMQFITPIWKNRVSMLVWYHYFFLDQKTTPYNVNMTPFNPANRAGDRELGHEIDFAFNVTINPRNSMLIGYSFFNAGDYYDTTAGVPTNGDAQFFYTQYQMRF